LLAIYDLHLHTIILEVDLTIFIPIVYAMWTLNPEDNNHMRILQECYAHYIESRLIYCVIESLK